MMVKVNVIFQLVRSFIFQNAPQPFYSKKPKFGSFVIHISLIGISNPKDATKQGLRFIQTESDRAVQSIIRYIYIYHAEDAPLKDYTRSFHLAAKLLQGRAAVSRVPPPPFCPLVAVLVVACFLLLFRSTPR